MATIWIFNSTSDSGHKPAIGGQLASVSENTLCLRNPWVTDSVFMGILYCAITVISLIGFYPQILPIILDLYNESIALMLIFLIFPFAFTPFLAYRIFFIKGLSTICLNRSTQKIYYQRLSKVFIFEWRNTGGGLFKRTENGGSSFSTSYALAFAPPAEQMAASTKKTASGSTATNPPSPASGTSPKSGNTCATSWHTAPTNSPRPANPTGGTSPCMPSA